MIWHLLKQVWALGRLPGSTSTRWSVKSLGPAAPVEPCDKILSQTVFFLKSQIKKPGVLWNPEVGLCYCRWQIATALLSSLHYRIQQYSRTRQPEQRWYHSLKLAKFSPEVFPQCNASTGYWSSSLAGQSCPIHQSQAPTPSHQMPVGVKWERSVRRFLKCAHLQETLRDEFIETFLQSQELLLNAVHEPESSVWTDIMMESR